MEIFPISVSGFAICFAMPDKESDVLRMIHALAVYEHIENHVVATEEFLHAWLFVQKRGKELLAVRSRQIVGLTLFFYIFSVFFGHSGIYLKDLFVLSMACKLNLERTLAILTKERGCIEWFFLDWNVPSIAFYRAPDAVPMENWTVYRLDENAFSRLVLEG